MKNEYDTMMEYVKGLNEAIKIKYDLLSNKKAGLFGSIEGSIVLSERQGASYIHVSFEQPRSQFSINISRPNSYTVTISLRCDYRTVAKATYRLKSLSAECLAETADKVLVKAKALIERGLAIEYVVKRQSSDLDKASQIVPSPLCRIQETNFEDGGNFSLKVNVSASFVVMPQNVAEFNQLMAKLETFRS